VKNDVTHQLARRLRSLREQHDEMTQEELSRRSKVSIKHIQALEGSNPYNTTILTLKKLADGFDMPLWKLLKFDE
jgi:transcriptional regulator with XRE-family HTH domain